MKALSCIRKLKRLGVYEQFKKNCYIDIKSHCEIFEHDCDKGKFLTFVSMAFVWDKTPEGFEFWDNISEK